MNYKEPTVEMSLNEFPGFNAAISIGICHNRGHNVATLMYSCYIHLYRGHGGGNRVFLCTLI